MTYKIPGYVHDYVYAGHCESDNDLRFINMSNQAKLYIGGEVIKHRHPLELPGICVDTYLCSGDIILYLVNINLCEHIIANRDGQWLRL
jgi:hypothetical protein